MGFNIAFGLTVYDGNKESIEDPDIGEVVAYYRSWGQDPTNWTVDVTQI